MLQGGFCGCGRRFEFVQQPHSRDPWHPDALQEFPAHFARGRWADWTEQVRAKSPSFHAMHVHVICQLSGAQQTQSSRCITCLISPSCALRSCLRLNGTDMVTGMHRSRVCCDVMCSGIPIPLCPRQLGGPVRAGLQRPLLSGQWAANLVSLGCAMSGAVGRHGRLVVTAISCDSSQCMSRHQ